MNCYVAATITHEDFRGRQVEEVHERRIGSMEDMLDFVKFMLELSGQDAPLGDASAQAVDIRIVDWLQREKTREALSGLE